MRNNKYNIKVSPAMQECSALLEFLCNHAGFKIVQGFFFFFFFFFFLNYNFFFFFFFFFKFFFFGVGQFSWGVFFGGGWPLGGGGVFFYILGGGGERKILFYSQPGDFFSIAFIRFDCQVCMERRLRQNSGRM